MSPIELLLTGAFSDFTLSCQKDLSKKCYGFLVHRAIVHGKSKILDQILEGESDADNIRAKGKAKQNNEDKAVEKADETKVIKKAGSTNADSINEPEKIKRTQNQSAVIEERPEIFAIVLWYLYTGKYPQTKYQITTVKRLMPITETCFSNLIKCHLDLLAVSERLMLPTLHKQAHRAIVAFIKEIKSKEERKEQDLNKALEYLYAKDTCTSDSIKKFVAWLCAQHVYVRHIRANIRPPQDFIWDLCADQEIATTNAYNKCKNCSKIFEFEEERAVVVRDEEHNFGWTRCFCLLRGLCSMDCKTSLFEVSKLWSCKERAMYCNECANKACGDFVCEWVRKCDVLHRDNNLVTCRQYMEGQRLVLVLGNGKAMARSVG